LWDEKVILIFFLSHINGSAVESCLDRAIYSVKERTYVQIELPRIKERILADL
jgi:hypothetical protein